MTVWMIPLLFSVGYCLARGVQDLRRKKYGWAILGLLSGAALLLTPIDTHATKWDLPRAKQR